MPPKKPSTPRKRNIDQAEQTRENDTESADRKVDNAEDRDHQSDANVSENTQPATKKTKTTSKATDTKKTDAKPNSKRATRSSAKPASKHDPNAIIKFLLSDDAINMLDQLETNNKGNFQFPRDRLNPFQDLIAGCMVSKPFSHRVATRAINNLFSKENSLTTPQEVLEFGRDKVLESLHRSKTLHKDKTTGQIIGIAEVCESEFKGDSSLAAIREQASHDPSEERALIIKSFKGYGPKTVDIFFRRVQVEWEEVYPFADEATIRAASEVGLEVEDADGLKELVDAAIDEKDDKERRSAFGRVVDVLVYLGLEHKTEEVESRIVDEG